MALRIISHYPAINAIDVPKNASIKVVFNSGINPATVTASTFSVNDAASYSTHPGTLGVEYDSSGVCTTAVFQPIVNFTANKKYRVYLFNTPNSILSVGNEFLTIAYTFEFVAGTGILIDPFPEGIPSGELPVSGELEVGGVLVDSGIYTDLIASGFRVIGTTPKHQTPNVDVNLSSIVIQFNTDLVTPSGELSGYISVSEKDVLY
jgi:hypothetical protein